MFFKKKKTIYVKCEAIYHCSNEPTLMQTKKLKALQSQEIPWICPCILVS